MRLAKFRGVAVGVLFLVCVLPSFAQEVTLKSSVVALFNTGWPGTEAAYKYAEGVYGRAKAAAPGDPRPSQAWALVQLKCRKFKEARGTLSEIARQFPADLTAPQTEVWLVTYLRDYQATLSVASGLAARLPKEEGASETEKGHRERAALIGRIFGFLAGPAPDSLSDFQLNEAEQQVKNNLVGARRTAFEEGRREVLKTFADLQAEKKSTLAANLAEEIKKKAADAAKIPSERTAIQTERASLEQQHKSAKAAFDSEESKLKKEVQPLRAEYDRLNDRAKPLLRKIQDANRDADRKEDQAKNEKDKNKAQQLRNDANRIRDSAKDEKNNLNRLQSDASKVEREYNQLEAKLRAAGQHYQGELAKLNAANNRLTQMDKALEQREKYNSSPSTGETGGTKALDAKLTALATYLPLTLDQEKQRVLDSLEK